jgi:exo-beta-1,3-glucanase (GH17 family)
MNLFGPVSLVLLAAVTSLAGVPAAALSPSNTAVESVRAAIASVRFIAYTPTDLQIVAGQVQPASREQIRRDLEILREDFDGLITYSSTDGVESVPEIGAALGFRAVIVGIWDPLSEREIANAIALAERWPELVVAICVGNETLLAERHPWPVLRAAMQRLRTALPGVAVTTSEPFYYYLDGEPADFVENQDFFLPSVHPLFQPWFAGAETAQTIDFVAEVAGLLLEQGKPVLIKETGLPSGPAADGFSPRRQAEFWTGLCRRLPYTVDLGIAYFEAFDHDWKVANAREEFGDHPEEAFWGLYRGNRQPKQVLNALRRSWRAPDGGYCGLSSGNSDDAPDARAR